MKLVFDLDGTLTDPALGVVRCMNYALTTFDYAPLADAEITQHIGPPLELTIARLTASEDKAHIDAVAAAYRERYGELGFRENEVYAGVAEMLEALQSAGHSMGVCTSKLQINADRVIEAFALDGFFEFIHGSSHHSNKTEQLAELLQQGVIDGDAIMIGDRAMDLIAAHSNGLRSAGVLWGYGSREELSAESPSYLFHKPAQLAAELTTTSD